MKKLIIGLLLTATAVTPALAQRGQQDGNRGWRNGGGQTSQTARPAAPNRATPAPRQMQAPNRADFRDRAARAQPRADAQRQAPAQMRTQAPTERRGFRGDLRDNARPDVRTERRAIQANRPGAGDGQRNWRQDRPDIRDGQRVDRPRRPDVRNDRPNDWRQGRPDVRDNGRRDNNRPDYRDRDRPGWQDRGNWQNNRNWQDRRQHNWDRGWRNDRRYDWQRYRARNRNIYRMPRYYAPRGWGYGYRRPSIGIYLDAMFFASNYWINDPWYYRLPPAGYGYRWIRYYNDALLIDERTGYVVDVINDFFY